MSASEAEIEEMADLVCAAMEGQLHMEQIESQWYGECRVRASVDPKAVAERLLLRGVQLPVRVQP